MAGVMRCPPDCWAEPLVCAPPHCSSLGNGCPVRRSNRTSWTEPATHYARRTLRYLWRHAPPPPYPTAAPHAPQLLLVTVTFAHRLQAQRLEQCARALRGVPNVLWIVVEDSRDKSELVSGMLARQWPGSGATAPLATRHLAHGPTNKGGNAQRNAALELIRREVLLGTVYFMDDDNGYAHQLWAALRQLHPLRVGVLAVRQWEGDVLHPPRCDGSYAPLAPGKRREHFVERPTYDASTGRFAGFETGWCDPSSYKWRQAGPRVFCLDMGGFAFDAALLHRLPAAAAAWGYTGHGGESEFVEKLLPNGSSEDLQPLANCGIPKPYPYP